MIDVSSQWTGTKFIQPNQSIASKINRTIGERDDSEELLEKRKSTKVVIDIQDFAVVE